jgi:hypothetical protein
VKTHSDEPRAYEEPTIVAIGALHELTLNKGSSGSDFCGQQDQFPSGTS